jgi:hypothetical protein
MRVPPKCLNRALAGLLLAVAGCGGQRPPDTAPVVAVFEVITNTNRFLLDQALLQIRRGDYTTAVTSLKEFERRYRLSPQQEIAVRTLRHELERRLPAAPPTPQPAAQLR